MKKNTLLFVSTALTVAMTAAASAFGAYDAGRPRDFYRLDSMERDFIRYDDDYNRAPYGSSQREIADRYRRAVYQDALREGGLVFTDRYQASGIVRESSDRANQYYENFRRAQRTSLRESFYSELTLVAFRGVSVDIEIFSQRARFYEMESITLETYRSFVNAPVNSTLERGYRDAFQTARDSALRVLGFEVSRLSYNERYQLEMDLNQKARTAPFNSALERFYRDALDVIRNGGGGGYPQPNPPYPNPPVPGPGPGPGPAPQPPQNREALTLMGVSREGTRVSEQGGELRLVKSDEIVIRGIGYDKQGNSGSVGVRATVSNSSDRLAVTNQADGSVLIKAILPMTGQPAVEMMIEGKLNSGTTKSVRLRVSVVRRAFNGFDRATANNLVSRAYAGILYRGADEAGLRQYVDRLVRDGMKGWREVLTILASSPEFAQNVRPNYSAREILANMYEKLLGPNRPLDPEAEAYLPALEQGRTAEVAIQIGTSEEFFDKNLP